MLAESREAFARGLQLIESNNFSRLSANDWNFYYMLGKITEKGQDGLKVKFLQQR
jgi:hypothetical protein